MLYILAMLVGAAVFASADFYKDWKKLRLEELNHRMSLSRRQEEFFKSEIK